MLRRFTRRVFPEKIRLAVKRTGRAFCDFPLALLGKFSRRTQFTETGFSPVFMLEQRIMPSPYLEQKIHNLQLAAGIINGVIIAPGTMFSFWRIIGKPDRAANFKASRTIREGRIEAAEGGGLCQVAGILYEAALRCGFAIKERYSHSMDIYAEEERFTPLGLDAAVVFGYKDLRFTNTSRTPVVFALNVSKNAIQLVVVAHKPADIAARTLVPLRYTDNGKFRRVQVKILDAESHVEKTIESQYLIPGKAHAAF